MDPVRNPYTPGAGQHPPELAGREREIQRFGVLLERVAHGRPERGVILTGPRGSGKTVLLNTFRSMAVQRTWGTGRIEARPGRSVRQPIAAAVRTALRALAPRHRAPERIEHALGVLASFARAGTGDGSDRAAQAGPRRGPGTDAAAVPGRADSGDLETDLSELLLDAASVAADLGAGIALFVDELQDVPAADVSALCAACHELAQNGGPLVLVGAGLPHLPAVLSAGKGYSERLFRYARVDRLSRSAADHALTAPALAEGARFDADALEALYEASGGHPFLVQAYGKAVWDLALRSPITADDVRSAVSEADEELAVPPASPEHRDRRPRGPVAFPPDREVPGSP
uniref:ATP-binding protein n=1 Tax=Actinorugispora endophytica TaxID=1605990 RepID=UPI001AADC20C|nr:ATP-binding protein [Actinorugispora endophytica]